MQTTTPTQSAKPESPLKEPVFRRIWTASLLSNFGQLILGVGAAWEMTRLTNSPSMVALVQTALMLPLMLASVPAGALADMYDRRKVAMAGLGFSVLMAVIFTGLNLAGLAGPWVILAFCSLIGVGVAIYAPAWQASINEQVQPAQIPAAIALGTISYNVARSFGPAIGGLVVTVAGASVAFGMNAVFYIPLLLAFFFWKRRQIPARLPPETMARAIVSGARFSVHSRTNRTALFRAFLFGWAGATAGAFAPLIAKDLLNGDAALFGILLGASGVGAVCGAMLVARLRAALGAEIAIRWMMVIGGVALMSVGVSSNVILTCIGLFVAGAANIVVIAMFNVAVQISSPRWVTARALSLFSSALTGGIALGAWFWGVMAHDFGLQAAIVASGIALLALPLIGFLLPLTEAEADSLVPVEIDRPMAVALPITMRSGPVVIEVDYVIAPENAREFYEAIRAMRRLRLRNGAFGWSIERDVGDDTLWTERYSCPTWGDYLRTRDRFTEGDLGAHKNARQYLKEGHDILVRRRLERPYGSVRASADTLDPRLPNSPFFNP